MDHKEIESLLGNGTNNIMNCGHAISTHNISALTALLLQSPPWNVIGKVRVLGDKDIIYIFGLGLQLYIKALLASKALQI